MFWSFVYTRKRAQSNGDVIQWRVRTLQTCLFTNCCSLQTTKRCRSFDTRRSPSHYPALSPSFAPPEKVPPNRLVPAGSVVDRKERIDLTRIDQQPLPTGASFMEVGRPPAVIQPTARNIPYHFCSQKPLIQPHQVIGDAKLVS